MKNITFFLSCLLICFIGFTQNNLHEIYSNGLINGKFKSFYNNGKIRAEGMFENNLKIGSWSVWDSVGNKVLSLTFEKTKNKYAYKIFYSNELDTFYCLNQKNELNYFPFTEVVPNNVLYSKRVWRLLKRSDLNKILFRDDNFINYLIELIEQNKIHGYSPQSDEFKIPLESDELLACLGQEIIAYKIKEDWFYDRSKFIGEARIIGICPVFKLGEKEKDAFWIYYPEVRTLLAHENYDEIFYLHNFNSTIIKESNLFDKYLNEYIKAENMEQEVLRIESNIIETEIDLWMMSRR